MISKHLLNPNIFFKLRILLGNYPFNADRIKAIQIKKLKKLLIYSYNHFQFYKERFDRAGFNPFNIKSVDEIRKIPVMGKAEYREFINQKFKKQPELYKKYYQDETSGSTGEPLKIYRTWNERAYMLAKYLRALFLNGYSYRDVTFCLPSPHRITKSDSFLQKLGLYRRKSIAYTEPTRKMVEGFVKSKADLLYANKSLLVQMAWYIKDNGIKIQKPRRICSSGELMDASSKRLIEDVFCKNRLFEVYGGVEFGNLAFQITGDEYFYFNHDTNLIELEDGQGVLNKERGKCIITDLNIFSFPLIRYKFNDWIEMDNRDGLWVITKIIGRDDDWVTFRDGSKIPFHPFYEIMGKRNMVKQFKFIQETLDSIDVYLVLEKNVDEEEFELALINELKNDISNSINFRIKYKDKIDPEPNGKLRMLISKV